MRFKRQHQLFESILKLILPVIRMEINDLIVKKVLHAGTKYIELVQGCKVNYSRSYTSHICGKLFKCLRACKC